MRAVTVVSVAAVALLATSATWALPLDGHDEGILESILNDFDENVKVDSNTVSSAGSKPGPPSTAATPAGQVQNKLVVPWDVLVASPAAEGIKIHDLAQYSVGREGHDMPEVLTAYVYFSFLKKLDELGTQRASTDRTPSDSVIVERILAGQRDRNHQQRIGQGRPRLYSQRYRAAVAEITNAYVDSYEDSAVVMDESRLFFGGGCDSSAMESWQGIVRTGDGNMIWTPPRSGQQKALHRFHSLAVLVDRVGESYSHWMLESLPRLLLYKELLMTGEHCEFSIGYSHGLGSNFQRGFWLKLTCITQTAHTSTRHIFWSRTNRMFENLCASLAYTNTKMSYSSPLGRYILPTSSS